MGKINKQKSKWKKIRKIKNNIKKGNLKWKRKKNIKQ